jgi:hypothetical protein
MYFIALHSCIDLIEDISPSTVLANEVHRCGYLIPILILKRITQDVANEVIM